MTPEFLAALLRFVAEYERICNVFCMQPKRHKVYQELMQHLAQFEESV